MPQDDLKCIWICTECRTCFLFHSDVDDHSRDSGHLRINKYGLLSDKIVDGIGIWQYNLFKVNASTWTLYVYRMIVNLEVILLIYVELSRKIMMPGSPSLVGRKPGNAYLYMYVCIYIIFPVSLWPWMVARVQIPLPAP